MLSGERSPRRRSDRAPDWTSAVRDRRYRKSVPERQPVCGWRIARQLCVREAEHKKLIGIRYRWIIRGLQQEIVIVRDPQGVQPCVVSEPDVRTERNSLNLRRDPSGRDTIAGKRCDNIQEQIFCDGVRGCGGPVLVGDIVRVLQIDLEELLYAGVVARSAVPTLEPSAVPFIYQELVIVDGQNFTDTRSRGEQIRVLVRGSAGHVDGNDAQKICRGTAL